MRGIRQIAKVVAVVSAFIVPNKLLEGKTYDAELTESVVQLLDKKYANDTTDVGKEWRIISIKENITANDVYDFLVLNKHWDARQYVEDICPTCVLGLAEAIRRSNLAGNGGGEKITAGGQEEIPQTQTKPNEVSSEARNFFGNGKVEVDGEEMSALDYLIKCGYLPAEIDSIYKKIKSDWGNEKPNICKDLLDHYTLEVTGRVLQYPGENKIELTPAQIDSLKGWALDTLGAAFEKSLGMAKKQWDNYNKWGNKSLDGIYNFCMDIRSLVGEGTKEGKAIEAVIKAVWPYTEGREILNEKIGR